MTLLDGSGARLDAVAVELSGRGIRLAVDQKLPSGTLVQVETAEALYLAETCYAVEMEDHMWQIGLKVDQVLNGLSDMVRLRNFVDSELPRMGSDTQADTARLYDSPPTQF